MCGSSHIYLISGSSHIYLISGSSHIYLISVITWVIKASPPFITRMDAPDGNDPTTPTTAAGQDTLKALPCVQPPGYDAVNTLKAHHVQLGLGHHAHHKSKTLTPLKVDKVDIVKVKVDPDPQPHGYDAVNTLKALPCVQPRGYGAVNTLKAHHVQLGLGHHAHNKSETLTPLKVDKVDIVKVKVDPDSFPTAQLTGKIKMDLDPHHTDFMNPYCAPKHQAPTTQRSQ
jgi:hypothetical protein